MNPSESPSPREMAAALAAPFPPESIGWKAQAAAGNRALAVAYIDARDVMDRLDAVVGAENWSDEYAVLADGNVYCTLSLRLGGEWLAKRDVGGESDQKDEGDRAKSAFSDSLKRAAVKWGVGRYLYRLPAQWVGYDPQRKQLTETPRLPAWAVPADGPLPEARPKAPAARPAPEKPQTGAELLARLKERETALVAQHLCREGELLAHVQAAGNRAGLAGHLREWHCPEPAYGVAREAALAFEKQRRPATAQQKEQIEEMLAAKGKSYEDLLRAVGVHPEYAGSLTGDQASRGLAWLGGLPALAGVS